MRYKKPLVLVTVICMAVLVVLAVCLLSNPVTEKAGQDTGPSGVQAENGAGPSGIQAENDTGETPPERNAEGQNVEEGQTSGWPAQIDITAPEISEDMPLGADGAILDYADEQIVIFHGYFGLFVYDKSEKRLIGAVDLKAIGCDATQGDNTCVVTVAADGSRVYLAPLPINTMYVYDVWEQSLWMEPHNLGEVKAFASFTDSTDFIDEYIGWRSDRLAVINKNDESVAYGYLASADETIGKLVYEERAGENIENASFTFSYAARPVFGEYFENTDAASGGLDAIGPSHLSLTYGMSIDEVTDTGAVVDIFNNSEKEITFGQDFKLQRLENNEWVDVEYIIDDWGFNAIGFPIAAGEHREQEVKWEWLYGKLPAGIYLLTKGIIASTAAEEDGLQIVDLGVQFVIPE